MRQYELRILSGCGDVLSQFLRPQCPIDKRHGHRLALGEAEDQPVTSGELRRLGFGTYELIDHLTLGHRQITDIDGEAKFRRLDFNRDLAQAKLTRERMTATVTALR